MKKRVITIISIVAFFLILSCFLSFVYKHNNNSVNTIPPSSTENYELALLKPNEIIQIAKNQSKEQYNVDLFTYQRVITYYLGNHQWLVEFTDEEVQIGGGYLVYVDELNKAITKIEELE